MRKFLVIVVTGIVLMCVLAGCGKETVQEEMAHEEIKKDEEAKTEEESIPESFMITSENYFDYQEGFECSAFASAYVLRHYGEKADGVELFKTFPQKFADDSGAPPYGITEFFGNLGYEATYECNGTIEDLKKQISKGAPVIVFIHVAEPYTTTHYTHYVPVVGYDSEYLYFAESLSAYANCKDEEGLSYNRKTEITKFEHLWANIDGFWDFPYFIITKTPSHLESDDV